MTNDSSHSTAQCYLVLAIPRSTAAHRDYFFISQKYSQRSTAWLERAAPLIAIQVTTRAIGTAMVRATTNSILLTSLSRSLLGWNRAASGLTGDGPVPAETTKAPTSACLAKVDKDRGL